MIIKNQIEASSFFSKLLEWKALHYMLISTLSFAGMNALVKYLVEINAFELVFFRCLGSLVISMVYLKVNNISFIGNQNKLLIGRSIAGVISMALFFTAIKIVPFGTTITLRYLAPIFAAAMAIFFLKERVKPIQWLFFALSFFGVLLIKGFDSRVSGFGLTLILASAFFSGLVYIYLRAIGERDHPVVVVNYFMAIAALVGGILCIPYWTTPTLAQLPILLSLGIFGYGGQLYMTKAFQIEKANKVAPMKYLEAAFAIIIGWLWFGEAYSFLGMIGIGLVILGMLLNLMTKST